MTKIKICGLSRMEDIEAANQYKPDYIGFVFAEGSKRRVTKAQAAALKAALDPTVAAVGVFVNAPLSEVLELCREKTIDIVQLHGDENEDYLSALKNTISNPVIKAIRVQSTEQLISADSLPCDALLLDSFDAEQYGGTGKTFDYTVIPSLKHSFFLAGGLSAGNLTAAIEACRPAAVDISGGVETNGVKDPEKMRAVIELVRNYDKKVEAVGRFGEFGGQYIPETLMPAVQELEAAYNHYKNDPNFQNELNELLANYAGRPSLLYYADKMTKDLGGAKIYLKREDLNHTGSHKINNVLGQVLLAKKMGKTRVIAETGAGQHGVATATAAALMGMECEIFMGKEDIDRQVLNVYRMELLGAKVHSVTSGTMTLKDAVNETLREWTKRVEDTHYVLGSVMGPHPFPTIVRDFQKVIGKEIKEQMLELEGELPDAVIACVGGGSNAMGSFYEFVGDQSVRLIGCEAAGLGIDNPKNAATVATGSTGVFHGMKSLFCQDEYGQIAPVYSISAGLDYPGIGPEHANLNATGRAQYVPITDDEAVNAFEYLSRTEGIIPAIESAHAVAYARKLAPTMSKNQIIVITLSGRGDKDVAAIARYRGIEIHD